MKGSTLILLCAIALAYAANVSPSQEARTYHCNPSEAKRICKDNTDNDDILIAHEHCDKFYKCSNGKPYASKCPSNLLYDPVKEECEWPSLVECGDRLVSDNDDDDDDDDSSSDVSGDNEDNSDSGSNENINTCNCNPGEANTICAEENSDGVLVAHENCNQFYKCDHGQPSVFTCPPNSLYNPYKRVCDWASTVECGDRVQPEIGEDCDSSNNNSSDESQSSSSNSSDESQSSSSDSSDESSSSNSSDESQSSSSDSSDESSSSNSSDESQSSSSDSSDESKSDSDDSSDNDATCNCNPEEAPAICAGTNSDGVLVAHGNCNQFYMCTHGRPVALTCPKKTLYNPQNQKCDWAYEVECGDRIIPEPEQDDDDDGSSGDGEIGGDDSIYDDPSQAPTVCAESSSNGILVAHENCNQFYQCSGGIPVAISCPIDLLFDILTQKCDWPRNVDCGSRIVPETDDECACNPRNAPALCSREGSDSKIIAHENCNQFYVCVAGAPISRSCPATLFYNIDKEVCDWPQNVDCAGRETESFSSLNKYLRSLQSFSK